MARLPQPGADSGSWGDILNDFLLQAHNADGTLKQLDQTQIKNLVNDLAAKVNAADLATVASTGAYADLAGKPSLSTVATSGSYTDLANKPTIPNVAGLQGGLITPGFWYGSLGARSSTVAVQNLLTVAPFFLAATATVNQLGCEVVTGAAGSTIRLGIYGDTGGGFPGNLLLDAGSIDASIVGGQSVSFTSKTLSPGLYWLAAVPQGGTPTIRIVYGNTIAPAGVGTLANVVGATPHIGPYQNNVTGALPATFTMNGQTQGPILVVFHTV